MNWIFCIGTFVAALLFGNCQARCRFPSHPKNGRVECNSLNYLEGDKCRVVCEEGHKLNGAKEAICKSGQWTQTLGLCKVAMCSVPKTSRLTISKPESCKTDPSPYNTFCDLSCPSGYLDRAGIYCNASGQWEGRDVQCLDQEYPVMECPAQETIIVKTDAGKGRATVRLPSARYTDNSQSQGGELDFRAYLDGEQVQIGQVSLTIGRHHVKYIVRDEASLAARCYFLYLVEDKEPPKLENCPGDITKTAKKGEDSVIVTWQKPMVTDNSGSVRVFCDRPNGSRFYKGTSKVTYYADDRSGNSVKCHFTVTVKVACVDHNDFPISSIDPTVTTGDACSIPASDLKKCEQPIFPEVPINWKLVCPKTCKECT